MLISFAKAKSGVYDDVVDACYVAGPDTRCEITYDLADHIGICRTGLHGLRCPLHVHDDIWGAQAGHSGQHICIECPCGDVIDYAHAVGYGLLCCLGMYSIYG